VKSLVKLYKDKFVCKLCLEPAEKDSIQCKICQNVFHFKCKDVSAHYQKHGVEDGSAVVLEWPLKTIISSDYLPFFISLTHMLNKTNYDELLILNINNKKTLFSIDYI